ncbi:tyrosine-protein phosphatase [Isobaculum melis]|uniref:Protein-tyrosine phosphatase n=1 Tax=Isobaculum melis TaxID=142588 RepID=A0A1H9SND5_9LACT|nr:tyrosine-protein phosphatase [Isobaculum melis]SER86388.1 protein-tyrosine phosphatase [Isobaculum melis]
MRELIKNGHQYTLIDEAIKSTDQVEIYAYHLPTFQLEQMIKVGSFTGSPVTFEMTDQPSRIYVTYVFAGQKKMISTRNLSLDGTFNTRDLGGYLGYEGRPVKWGVLFRSDALHQVSPQDLATLKALPLKTVVDFRSHNECEKAPDMLPDETAYLNLSPNAPIAALASGNMEDDGYKVAKLVALANSEAGPAELQGRLDEMSEQMRELVRDPYANQQYRAYLRLLLAADTTPILHHCKGGKDRAGFAAILILAALGVSKEEIKYDYMYTKQNMAARNEKRLAEYQKFTDNQLVLAYLSGLMQTKEIYFEAAYDEIEKVAGSMDRYLRDIMELTEADFERLRELYLAE